jgi:hypothetical protein
MGEGLSPKGGNLDCTMIAAAPVLFAGYVVSASRIADRRMMLAGYCTLLFDDGAFCFHIYQMLTGRCGKSVRQIGAIDLRYTL